MSDGTTNKSEDDLPLTGYFIAVSEILRFEGRGAWADNISKAASKINKMQDEIEKLQDENKHWSDGHDTLVAENEKLRAALKPFLIEHWPEHKVYGYKMVFVTPDDLRAAAAALKETGDD